MATLNESNMAREGSAPGTFGNVGDLNDMVLAVFVVNSPFLKTFSLPMTRVESSHIALTLI